MRKVVVITHADFIWHFPLWERTLRLLARSFRVSGIILLPPRVGSKAGHEATWWHLRTFPLHDLFLFFAFGLKQQLKHFFPRNKTWERLGAAYRCPVMRLENPNSPSAVRWMKENEIDIAFVTCDYILKKPLIDSVKLGIINKHSSILPGYRGLFSYFWSRLMDDRTGFSFHVVDEGIDTGPVLVEQRYPLEGAYTGSFLRYHLDVFHLFPDYALAAAERMCRREFLARDPQVKSSYFGLPERKDVLKFKKKTPIASWSDLFYSPAVSLPAEEREPLREAV